ncbi:hypothetical protein [Pseudooceanicola algae]|uniref:Uncharacterized protein n=1 Tax=Pseudooceanicola algae TaxID=1537215 RepID=A0A418SDN8_9RHOB|nr:hypothetical protein [Pseudooceanicola algae]QPM89398.1 hypothetical protein PSAL_006140 [Pseudooceanicola algae]
MSNEALKASTSDPTWSELMTAWEQECSDYEENLADYASASLPILDELARGTPTLNAATYVLKVAGAPKAAFQANRTFLPGYTGKVLRIRHIVTSPKFDFDNTIDYDEYIDVMVGVFSAALDLAYGELASDHIKFHLKSPVERTFGHNFTDALRGDGAFKIADIRGSWIYLSKV